MKFLVLHMFLLSVYFNRCKFENSAIPIHMNEFSPNIPLYLLGEMSKGFPLEFYTQQPLIEPMKIKRIAACPHVEMCCSSEFSTCFICVNYRQVVRKVKTTLSVFKISVFFVQENTFW